MSIDLTTYSQLALSIADAAIQSRVGFGSFGKHEKLFRQSHRLILRSSLLAVPNGTQNPYWAIDPEFLHFAIGHSGYNFSQFIRGLAACEVYHPQCIWALFWALAKGEHEFARRYLPFWSHEERLTGHFVSQICERIWEFECHWRALSNAEPNRSWLDIWYADTATGNREKLTGADLGLIINGQYSGDVEFYKAARFQVKKVPASNTATIDLDQTKALIRTEGLGYYLFFHGQDRQDWRRPPSVAPATAFARQVTNAEKAIEEGKRMKKELGIESANNIDNESFDFATFVTFALADPSVESGAIARSKSEAVRVLMADGAPSRLMVISLGQPVNGADWLNELGEYVRIPRGDNG